MVFCNLFIQFICCCSPNLILEPIEPLLVSCLINYRFICFWIQRKCLYIWHIWSRISIYIRSSYNIFPNLRTTCNWLINYIDNTFMRCILCSISRESVDNSAIYNIVNIFREFLSSRICVRLLVSLFYSFVRLKTILPIFLSFLSYPNIFVMISCRNPVKCSIFM